MEAKDLLISVGELYFAMKDAHINAITVALVEKRREQMETMLPAFLFKDNEERQVFIERALIFYEMGIKDGINEWQKKQYIMKTIPTRSTRRIYALQYSETKE